MLARTSMLCVPLFVAGVAGHPCAQDGSTWRAEGDQAGARFGSALATADVNGDGYGDLVVGAPLHDDQFHDEGRVSVYLGSASGLATTPAWERHGRQTGAHLGAVVVNAGDVNGDGFDDIAFGAPEHDVRLNKWNPYPFGSIGVGGRYAPNEGRVVVYLGSVSGLGLLPNRVLDGIEFREHFGTAMAGVGDVNGDGFDDLLAGAPGKSEGRGGALLFSGSASGVLGAPSWVALGPVGRTGFGRRLAPAGDVSGDGFADFMIERPVPSCSRVALYSGSAAGPGAEVVLNEGLTAFGPAVDLDGDSLPELFFATSGCAGTGLRWRQHGLGTAGSFPTLGVPTAAVAGDFDGDGAQDLFASLPGYDLGPFHGRVFGYMGRSGTITPTDSFPAFDGDQSGAEFGAALATIDVDGDGADELFVAAPAQDAGAIDDGLVVMYPGAPATLVLEASVVGFEPGKAVVADFDGDGFSDLLCSNGPVELEVRYGSPSGLPSQADGDLIRPALDQSFSYWVDMTAGDVNGDGHADVLISFHPYTFSHGGSLFADVHALYLGNPTRLARNAALVLSSSGSAAFVGDVNGDGFDDLFVTDSTTTDALFSGSTGLPSRIQEFPSSPLHSPTFGFGTQGSILPARVDEDGFGDVVVLRLDPTMVYLEIELYRGSSSGLQFVSRSRPTTASFPDGLPGNWFYEAFFCDLDGDARDDLWLEAYSEPVLMSGGPLGFQRSHAWWILPGNVPWSEGTLGMLDVDGDGHNDLLRARNHLHLGGPTGVARSPAWHGLAETTYTRVLPTMPADFDGDGLREILLQSNQSLTLLEVTPP